MFRRDLIEVLQGHGRSLRELDIRSSDLEDDLQHLLKSLRHSRKYRAHITPARCRHCGLVFHHDELDKPGKCPRCRHTWIEAPLIAIERIAEP